MQGALSLRAEPPGKAAFLLVLWSTYATGAVRYAPTELSVKVCCLRLRTLHPSTHSVPELRANASQVATELLDRCTWPGEAALTVFAAALSRSKQPGALLKVTRSCTANLNCQLHCRDAEFRTPVQSCSDVDDSARAAALRLPAAAGRVCSRSQSWAAGTAAMTEAAASASPQLKAALLLQRVRCLKEHNLKELRISHSCFQLQGSPSHVRRCSWVSVRFTAVYVVRCSHINLLFPNVLCR